MLTKADQHTGPGNPLFKQLKSPTPGIYYNSEIGYLELNKGGRVPATFACGHSSHA